MCGRLVLLVAHKGLVRFLTIQAIFYVNNDEMCVGTWCSNKEERDNVSFYLFPPENKESSDIMVKYGAFLSR